MILQATRRQIEEVRDYYIHTLDQALNLVHQRYPLAQPFLSTGRQYEIGVALRSIVVALNELGGASLPVCIYSYHALAIAVNRIMNTLSLIFRTIANGNLEWLERNHSTAWNDGYFIYYLEQLGASESFYEACGNIHKMGTSLYDMLLTTYPDMEIPILDLPYYLDPKEEDTLVDSPFTFPTPNEIQSLVFYI